MTTFEADDDHSLFHSGTYEGALNLARSYMPGGELSLDERVEIALTLADEQAERGYFQLAVDVLEAALEELTPAELWLSRDALTVRLNTVKVLDRLAWLNIQLGQGGRAFLRAQLARDLSKDLDGDYSQADDDRIELMRQAARITGRKDHWDESPSMPETLSDTGGFESLRSPGAAPGRMRKSVTAPGAPRAPSSSATGYHEVPVYFATNRNRTGRANPYDYFRGKRAPLSLGRAVVTVPRDRQTGDFRTASRDSWKTADKARLITIDTIALFDDRESFWSEMSDDIQASRRKEALVFVHGYNTSFAGAVMRAGQLSIDLDIDGATVLYSWPSKASLMSYVVDRNQVIDPFLEELKSLIVRVALDTGARRVHLLAHSMGAQFLLDALLRVKLEDRVRELGRPIADEVIFASPDVDAQNFVGQIQRVRDLAGRVTVYSSREDRALQASELLQGAVRAGRAPEIVCTAGVDTIDTTEAQQDFVGHSDYSSSAIDDVRSLVWIPARVSPEKRAAILSPDAAGPFWHYSVAAAKTAGPAFRKALEMARQFGLEMAVTELEINATRPRSASSGPSLGAVKKQLEALLGQA